MHLTALGRAQKILSWALKIPHWCSRLLSQHSELQCSEEGRASFKYVGACTHVCRESEGGGAHTV